MSSSRVCSQRGPRTVHTLTSVSADSFHLVAASLLVLINPVNYFSLKLEKNIQQVKKKRVTDLKVLKSVPKLHWEPGDGQKVQGSRL